MIVIGSECSPFFDRNTQVNLTTVHNSNPSSASKFMVYCTRILGANNNSLDVEILHSYALIGKVSIV